jgi:hypothetical protein
MSTGHDPGPAQEVADRIVKAGGGAIADSSDVSTVGMDELRARRPAGVPPHMEPELVAPLVAFLAHESCPVSAGIYLAGAGRFARMFVAATDGYLPTSTLDASARFLSHRF